MASIRRVAFFHAQGCHLCDRARDVLERVGVPYESVDITGVPEL
ncbi:MAG TPA: glutaredoxin domain-containing protein, partial [Candidatus Binatia bacterium]|nr:glutaredoxin domain-containing protein [Candidatus Binatia bacterium]